MWLIYTFVHLGDSLAHQVPIADTDIYKCSFTPPRHPPTPRALGMGMHFQTLFNISSAENAKDGVAKFTSLVRAIQIQIQVRSDTFFELLTALLLIKSAQQVHVSSKNKNSDDIISQVQCIELLMDLHICTSELIPVK